MTILKEKTNCKFLGGYNFDLCIGDVNKDNIGSNILFVIFFNQNILEIASILRA